MTNKQYRRRKGNRRDGEEIERDDHFAVVLKKGEPTIGWVAAAVHATEVACDAAFGDREAELEKFAMDPGSSQPGFSCVKRRIRSPTSSVILGLPGRRRDRHRQYHRKPARCQATTVSGLTIRRTLFQPDQKRRSAIQNSRSKEFKGGRGRFRLRMATC
jgi:hypothetical protein